MVSQPVHAGRGHAKKLIAALLLAVDETFAGYWNCALCDEETKAARGCGAGIAEEAREGIPDGVWRIDFCLAGCGGDPECERCKGSDATPVWRCPRMLLRPEHVRLLPYFLDWWRGKEAGGVPPWPDGRGRLYQPARLKAAFALLDRQMDLVKERLIAKGAANAKGH
jgi:hypothetical protein